MSSKTEGFDAAPAFIATKDKAEAPEQSAKIIREVLSGARRDEARSSL